MTVDEWHTRHRHQPDRRLLLLPRRAAALRKRGGGWIINISSLASKNPFVNGAAYCASKAALNAFSEALMQEVRYDGIRVAYVLPGSVNTGFGGLSNTKSEWALKPDDVAEVVVDLLAHPVAQPAEPRRDPSGAAAAEGLTCLRFDKHRDELERHETMMGPSRGRLAVALDLLTDALAMVGQHGVYCQSARTPGRPTMDIATGARADRRRQGAACRA